MQVSFHFAYPVTRKPAPMKGAYSLDVETLTASCKNPRHVLKKLLKTRTMKMISWREDLLYPQNLMRNIAKGGCGTKFTFIPGTCRK